MSLEDHPFRWVPSLQHMTKVKIIETLLRNSKLMGILKPLLIMEAVCKYEYGILKMRKKIEAKVNDLPIPEVLKIDFEYPVRHMVRRAHKWLDRTNRSNRRLKSLDGDWTEAICFFTDNFFFTNFGCVDGRKILESYVSGKEIVGYWVWHELCLYCIEDKIVEFSKKIDWQECSNCLNSPCAVYWYRKIHGKLPSDEMLTDCDYLRRAKKNLIGPFSNEENLIRNMLKTYIEDCSGYRSLEAIVYFRNQLNDDGELNKLVSDILFDIQITPAFMYLIRTRAKDAHRDFHSYRADDILRGLMSWPWIFFIDNWKHMFYTNVDKKFFIAFLDRMGQVLLKMTGNFKVVLYRVCEELVGILHERFISDVDEIAEVFWNAFFNAEAGYVCSVILKGLESHQRKFVIEAMREYVYIWLGNNIDVDGSDFRLYHTGTAGNLDRSEYKVDEMFSDEEKEFFWEIHDQYLAEMNPQ